ATDTIQYHTTVPHIPRQQRPPPHRSAVDRHTYERKTLIIKENGSAVDDRGFTFLIILAAIVCYHLYAIPDKSLWAGDLQLSPVLYSVGGLVGQGLIAILYGAPYSAIVINGIGSSVAFILGLAGLAGLYDWMKNIRSTPATIAAAQVKQFGTEMVGSGIYLVWAGSDRNMLKPAAGSGYRISPSDSWHFPGRRVPCGRCSCQNSLNDRDCPGRNHPTGSLNNPSTSDTWNLLDPT
ncbi:unnamed protein product, partial [Adineta ricciae]